MLKGLLKHVYVYWRNNFGFTSGANHYEKFAPDVTSYDYDALLNEHGDITEKYLEVRKVIQKYVDHPLPQIPDNRPVTSYGKVKLNQSLDFFDALTMLSEPVETEVPQPMEYYSHGYGYIAYQTRLNRDYKEAELSFESLGDRAQIYINRELVDLLYINDSLKTRITAKDGDILTVLVENMGRCNFGSKMMRKKGIVGRCLLDGKIHFHWKAWSLPMDHLQGLSFKEGDCSSPSAFYRGKF